MRFQSVEKDTFLNWLLRAKEGKYDYCFIVYDYFDDIYYPINCREEGLEPTYRSIQNSRILDIVEVYDLNQSLLKQVITKKKVFNLPFVTKQGVYLGERV